MADIGFVDSGNEVAQTLQQILARKEKARHDQLLEQIAQQDSNTRQMLAQGQEEERKDIAKWREAQADNYRRDDMVRGQKLSPEDSAWLRDTGFGGRIESAPAYELPEGAQGPVPQEETYFDPSKFQKADADHHIYVMDEATGKVSIQDPPGAKLSGDIHMTRSRPPIGPDRSIANEWKFSDDGQFVMGLPKKGSTRPTIMKVEDLMKDMGANSTFGRKPPTGGSGRVVPIIPPNLVVPSSKANSAQRMQLMAGVLANSGAQPNVKSAFQEYLDTAKANPKVAAMPLQQILENLDLPDNEKREFALLHNFYMSGVQ